MGFSIPEAAIDVAEREWYARVSRGQYDPPREHIRALFEVAMPFLMPVQGEIVSNPDDIVIDTSTEDHLHSQETQSWPSN